MPKIWNKYSQKRNIGASDPISTFMCLWANYIFPRWVCLFCLRKYVDRSWEYINRSQTRECGNWGWGRAIPRKGIYKQNCRCSVVLLIGLDIPGPKGGWGDGDILGLGDGAGEVVGQVQGGQHGLAELDHHNVRHGVPALQAAGWGGEY